MGPESRTYIDENNKCVWGDNEKIYVTSKDGKTTGVLSLTQKSEDGTSATFSGFVFGDPADLYYSVYPVPENGVIDITHIDGANHNAPMAGVISNGSVAFDYACGLVRMEVEGVDVMTVSVVPTADNTKQVAGGSYTFNPETGEWSFAEGEGITVSIPENDIVYIPVNGTKTKQEAKLTATLILSNGTTVKSPEYSVEVVEDGLDASSVPGLELDADGKIDETTYFIASAEDLKEFAKNVLDEEGKKIYDGKTVKLLADIDLTGVTTNGDSFGPIGRYCSGQGVNKPFTGHFDGQGHTIKGIYQSGWDFGYEWGTTGYLGLFGYVKDATIENLTIEGMESVVEGGTLAAIAGRADGECTFKNITVKNSKLGTYNNRCGGIVGWTGGYYKDEAETEVACHFIFENIEICEDVVLGGLWGSFDSSIGGVMGQLNSAGSASFKNVTVSCRIDAYNDCTASYDYYLYRMCGMLIGQMTKTTVIEGSTYPDVAAYGIEFDNVTVNYGTWMNYHYCEPTPGLNGGRGMRVEAGFTYDGLPSDYDHTQCVDNHYNCIPFDQLFGGTQTACKGVKSWEGVTVHYPAEYTCTLCNQKHNVSNN